jgi:hypothetical protein
MRKRHAARLSLGRTILVIAAAYLLALQGLTGALAAGFHAGQRLDRTASPLCLSDPGSTHPDSPVHGDDPASCCRAHCAGHSAAAAAPVPCALPLAAEAPLPAAGAATESAAAILRGAFSARAPPVAA